MKIHHSSHLRTLKKTFVSITKNLMSLPLLLSSPQIYRNFLRELDEQATLQNLGFMLAENMETEIGGHITTSPYLAMNHAGTVKRANTNTQEAKAAVSPVTCSKKNGA